MSHQMAYNQLQSAVYKEVKQYLPDRRKYKRDSIYNEEKSDISKLSQCKKLKVSV